MTAMLRRTVRIAERVERGPGRSARVLSAAPRLCSGGQAASASARLRKLRLGRLRGRLSRRS